MKPPLFLDLKVELEPLPVPSAARSKATANRQVSAVSIELEKLDLRTLDALVEEWVAAVYLRAGKRGPDLRFPFRRTPIHDD